ncbi:MAG: 30S ribosomal protein S20 [Fimbriimonadales bacterium]
MPNIKSMNKDLKRNEKRRVKNQAVQSALKTYIKKARTASGEDVASALATACKQLDKAAQRGVIHKNQAARRKSRVMKAASKAAGK